MLSDMSSSTFSFDIPVLPDCSTPHPEEDPFTPLNFDDLLDIAREFEFARTITHIWPCEEEPTTSPETRLDDLLAAILPMPTAEASPIPLPSSAESMTFHSVQVQEVHSHGTASVRPASTANACISTDPVPLRKGEDQVRAETAASALQGWSPPNRSQFLDLDDSLLLPQPAMDMVNSPWLAMFLPTSSQPTGEHPSSATVSAISHVQPTTAPEPSLASTTDMTADESSVPTLVQPSTRAILEPVQAQTAAHTNPSVPSRTAMPSRAKTPQPRSRLSSTPGTGGTSTANHARAPRGGIPPHIARSVTKANILRAEKERKVMQDAFSRTTTREAKKPSVLRGTAKVEKETYKSVNGGDSRKTLYGSAENDRIERRAAKRARV